MLVSKRRKQLSAICYLGGFGTLFLLYGTLSLLGNNLHSQEATGDSPGSDLTGLDGYNTQNYEGRHLLFVLPNCTPPAIEQFPQAGFTQAQRRQGAVALHVLVALYMFVGLAIACDDYFVPALERICEAMNLQPDVAGATFMAAGSSAPELATAVIGVFIAKDDIGLSAVVGSAVFNILFVVSICALFAGAVVYLHWWPLFRDSVFYLISIIALVVTIMDERIYWYEATALLVLYALYIVVMYFNKPLEDMMVKRLSCCPSHAQDCDEDLHGPEKVPHHQIQMTPTTRVDTDSEESGLDSDEDRHSLLPSSGQVNNHHQLHLQRPPPSEFRPG